MKKNVARILITLVSIILLTSCGREQSDSIIIPSYDDENVTEIVTQEITANKAAVEYVEDKILYNENSKQEFDSKMTPYRDKLSENEKKLYDKIRESIYAYSNFTMDPVYGQYSEEEFINAVDALYGDNAELWLFLYVTNEYAPENEGGYATKMSVVPSYNWRYEDVEFDAEYMSSYIEDINEVCDEIIGRMPQDATLEQKYEFLGREICNRTDYVDKSENEELYEHETGDKKSWAYCYMNGPFLYGEGICQAYAQAYQYLCNRAGLWCICTGGGCHEWNLIMDENGKTYHVDLTWADGLEFDSYFMLTQEEIEYDHTHEDKDVWCATGK